MKLTALFSGAIVAILCNSAVAIPAAAPNGLAAREDDMYCDGCGNIKREPEPVVEIKREDDMYCDGCGNIKREPEPVVEIKREEDTDCGAAC
ncbi:hypothetical protein BO70DRAFT_150224 [Aspergillus heteromorphus CBS 117.55]|uniref:Uncharacterized protein n=1 Tax=Aspergillus heteromorphus CBS 117.55 TaxID=1448321 RepID=A0A317V810_9EURO|nr:uncharacterized protein BO70DRAFT_150224 [Aspergillus heteromorphus CBS 117.55]PWY69127.1 hypothetical protein BO70DRAFT_150224 [Aspergillus heteromorphus CBS 117.55]